MIDVDSSENLLTNFDIRGINKDIKETINNFERDINLKANKYLSNTYLEKVGFKLDYGCYHGSKGVVENGFVFFDMDNISSALLITAANFIFKSNILI